MAQSCSLFSKQKDDRCFKRDIANRLERKTSEIVEQEPFQKKILITD